MIAEAGGVEHWLEAPGGVRLRAAHWPEGARGTVLLLNGRTEFIEKYLEPIAELQARGFAVWTLDWRGQGLSTRLLPDPVPHYVRRFEDYLADLDLLLERLVLPGLGGRKLVVLGHSMGANLAVRAMARRPDLYACGILCCPMIDFLHGPAWQRGALRRFVRAVSRLPGMGARPFPGPAGRPYTPSFEANRLTHSPERYARDQGMVRDDPRLLVGGVTWQWLAAASNSIHHVRRPRFVRALTMPILVLTGGADTIVDNPAIAEFAARLPQGTLIEIPEARHELLRESDPYRQAAWAAIDAFLPPASP